MSKDRPLWITGQSLGGAPAPKLPMRSLVANDFLHVSEERLLGQDPMTGIADAVGTVAAKAACRHAPGRGRHAGC